MNFPGHANGVPFAFGGDSNASEFVTSQKGQLVAAYLRRREESLRDMLLEAFSEIEIRNRLIQTLRDAKPVAAKVNSKQ